MKEYTGLWLNKKKSNSKQPILIGSIHLDNRVLKISIWKNEDRSNNKPDYTLCLSDEFFHRANADELD